MLKLKKIIGGKQEAISINTYGDINDEEKIILDQIMTHLELAGIRSLEPTGVDASIPQKRLYIIDGLPSSTFPILQKIIVNPVVEKY